MTSAPPAAPTNPSSSCRAPPCTVARDRDPNSSAGGWYHEPARRPRLLRPSARTLDALLHGDVGAVLVLRDPPAPRAVHDRRARARWLRLRSPDGVGDRRHLRGERVSRVAAGRLDRRPLARSQARDLD